jgi:hypothetical protein
METERYDYLIRNEGKVVMSRDLLDPGALHLASGHRTSIETNGEIVVDGDRAKPFAVVVIDSNDREITEHSANLKGTFATEKEAVEAWMVSVRARIATVQADCATALRDLERLSLMLPFQDLRDGTHPDVLKQTG